MAWVIAILGILWLLGSGKKMQAKDKDNLYSAAQGLLGTPNGAPLEILGGRANDCSALVLAAGRFLGRNLPATAKTQYQASQKISESEARSTPGALIFFSRDGTADGVYHVAISSGDGKTIETLTSGTRSMAWGWWSEWSTFQKSNHQALFGLL